MSAHSCSTANLSDCIEQGKDRFWRLVKNEAGKQNILLKEVKEIKNKYLLLSTVQTSANVMLKDIIEGESRRTAGETNAWTIFCSLEKPFVDKEASFDWLRSAGLKGETESLIVAVQDLRTLSTRHHQRKILKKQIDGNCKVCDKAQETKSHLAAGCPMLASIEYLHRHNRVASYVHWVVCRELGCEVPNKWYGHTPRIVVNIDENTILWDYSIISDRKILANSPDVVIHDRKSKTCLLIDVSVPDNKNITLKEAEKVTMYLFISRY